MPQAAHYCQWQGVAEPYTRLGAVRAPSLHWHGWCCSRLDQPPTVTGRAVGGAPGRAERLPALGSTRATGPGGSATVHVNGGARVGRGHEATDTGLAYAPVSQAHGHNHIVQCFSSLHCSAD